MVEESFIRAMPKVELHVHLEGSIRPETLLVLAARNHQPLPADTVEGLQEWYSFRDFPHFVDVYLAIARCIRTPADVELIATDFLAGQASQNIMHSEITYTAFTQYMHHGIALDDQLAALNRARDAAAAEFGISASFTIDYPRMLSPEDFVGVADWAVANKDNGVSALGLGGPEVDFPAELFVEGFRRAVDAGLPSAPHAGETVGPSSIWGAIDQLHADRIGHGVRCLEDPSLVSSLRERQIPLEVCPTSNICLRVFPAFEDHPLPRLIDAGLYVTVNSDDPPMFGTTLTDEYLKSAATFAFGADTVRDLVLNAARASFLDAAEQADLVRRVEAGFQSLPLGEAGSDAQ